MGMKHALWSLCLCTLLMGSCTPEAQLQEQITSTLANNDSVGMVVDSPVLISGGGGQGWGIVRKDGMFDLLAHSTGGTWQWAGVDIQGRVTAACTDAQGQLLLMTHSPNAILVVSQAGGSPQIGPGVPRAHWPDNAQAVATCMRPGGEGNADTLLILLARPDGDDTDLTLLALTRNAWQDLGQIGSVSGKGLHYALATGGGRIYLQMTSDQGGWLYQSPMREAQLATENPRPLKWTHQTTSPATTLLTVSGSIYRLALASKDKQWSLTMGPLDPNAPATLPTSPVTLNNSPLLLSGIPQAAGFGDQVVLLWYDGQQAKYTFCDAHGVAEPARDLIQLNSPPPNTDGVQLYQYFFTGLLGLTLVAMFVIPAKAPLGPVILPVIYRPAPLGKRLMASVIDLALLGMPYFFYLQKSIPTEVTDWNSLVAYRTAQEQLIYSHNGAVATIATLVAILVYCIVLEMRFGATLGKAVFKLKTVSANGLPLGWREAIIRNTVKVLSLALFPYLPVLIMALNPARQRLGDMFGRSIVVAPTGAKLPEGVSVESLYESLQTGQPPEQNNSGNSDDSAE